MKQQTDDETELRRYLLGELPQEERAQVEERLFLSSDYFRQMQAAEDDLVDDYVYEELSAADRGRFETYFLSQPGRREDIKIARALRAYISAEAQSPLSDPDLPQPTAAENKVVFFPSWRRLKPLARLSLAAAALIVLAVCLWLVIRAVRSREQSPPQQAQQPAPQETVPVPQPDESPQPEREQRAGQGNQGNVETQVANRTKRDAPRDRGPSPEPRELPGRTLAVLLIPGSGVRGGGGVEKVPLQPDVRLVNFQLPLVGVEEKYRDYLVTIETGGKTILTTSGLKPADAESGRVISLSVPAKLLSPATYQVKLRGVLKDGEARDITTYAFQVETR